VELPFQARMGGLSSGFRPSRLGPLGLGPLVGGGATSRQEEEEIKYFFLAMGAPSVPVVLFSAPSGSRSSSDSRRSQYYSNKVREQARGLG